MDRGPIKLSFVSCTTSTRDHGESSLFHSMACYQLSSFLGADPMIAESFDISIEAIESSSLLGGGLTPEDYVHTFARTIARGTKIVACSVYLWNVELTHELVQALKQFDPTLIAIAGGPEVFDRHDFAQTFPGFDILVEGDGEIPLREILLRLRRGAELEGIPNVSYRSDGAWVHNRSAVVTTVLEELPDLLAQNRDKIYGCGFYLGVRGCPKRCAYCLWARQPLSARRRETVLRDLETLFASGRMRRITFFDYDVAESYRSDPELFEAMIRLRERYADDVSLVFFSSPRYVVEPVMSVLLDRLRVDTIIIGLQSASRQALQAVNRSWAKFPLELFEQVPFELRSRFRVELVFPLPGETPQSFLSTLRYLTRLGFGRLRVFDLLVLRGTKLHRKRQELGLRCLSRPPYMCLETPQAPLADVLRISQTSRVLTLLADAVEFSAPNAQRLVEYCRAHPDLVDLVLGRIDAGEAPEQIFAAIARDILPAPEAGDWGTRRKTSTVGRILSAETQASAVIADSRAAAGFQNDSPLFPHLGSFFAARGISLVDSRRDGSSVIFELSSSQGSWSITLRPKGSRKPSYRSTRFYDVSYQGQAPPLEVVSEFVQLIKTVESRRPPESPSP